jgi:histidyl-tRNA synthetase
MGMERLVLLLIEQGVVTATPTVDVYVVAVGSEVQCLALSATESLREQLPQLRIVQHAGGGSFKSQMKKADKSGARVALIWGEDEVAAQAVTVKSLRASDGERAAQVTVALQDLETTLCAALAP